MAFVTDPSIHNVEWINVPLSNTSIWTFKEGFRVSLEWADSFKLSKWFWPVNSTGFTRVAFT